MKTIYKILFLFFLPVLVMTDMGFAQSFYTGGIGIAIYEYGRIRVYSDNLTTRQVDRSSILVGVSSTAVFDYNEDAENVIPPATVSSPQYGDYEVTVTTDNSYSSLPPAVEVEHHVFGWNSGGYAVAKLIVKNNETTAINAVIGMEIIPQIDGDYASINTSYDASSHVVVMNSTSYVGYKFFSNALTSMHSLDWFDGYGNDADYYTWLTQNSFDSPFTCGADGAVVIMGSAPVSINPGESYDFYLGISIGADETTMMSNMSTAQSFYDDTILPVELTSFTAQASSGKVMLNWATSTEVNNHGFEIERRIISANSQSDWSTIGFKEGAGTTTEKQEYTYVDNVNGITATSIQYRLKQLDFDGTFEYSNVVETNILPTKMEVFQNYPNPFNPSTVISFSTIKKEMVTVKVFNTLGQEVATLINSELEAGNHNVTFDASGLTSGIYVYSVQAGDNKYSRKMMLIK